MTARCLDTLVLLRGKIVYTIRDGVYPREKRWETRALEALPRQLSRVVVVGHRGKHQAHPIVSFFMATEAQPRRSLCRIAVALHFGIRVCVGVTRRNSELGSIVVGVGTNGTRLDCHRLELPI